MPLAGHADEGGRVHALQTPVKHKTGNAAHQPRRYDASAWASA